MTHIDDNAVLWSADETDRARRPLLVMLHGWGSHEGDLFGLSPYLPLEPVVASLRAPLSQPPGYAWYPLTMRADAHGDVVELRSIQDEVDAAVAAVEQWISAHAKDVPVALLGFSQGGAMALQLLRSNPDRFACAVVLSGFVIDSTAQADAELERRRPPVFWGRGTEDAVIPRAAVARTDEWLQRHAQVDARIYEGLSHGVDRTEIADVAAFLAEHLA